MSNDPGSVPEREKGGERTVVRPAGRHTSENVHWVLFEDAPEPRTPEELKEGVRKYLKNRQARRDDLEPPGAEQP